jgi:membrane protein YqaA with SNARE-associated domain
VWGFAEATLFFIVPDVLLTLVALFSFRRSARVLVCILLGALTGGAIMFYLGAKDPAQARLVFLRVPFVSQAMFDKTQGFLRWNLGVDQRSGTASLTKSIACGRQILRTCSFCWSACWRVWSVLPVLADSRAMGSLFPKTYPPADGYGGRTRLHLDHRLRLVLTRFECRVSKETPLTAPGRQHWPLEKFLANRPEN